MSRLSIELSEHQHQKIKALAALNGSSIKEYILEKTLPDGAVETTGMTEAQALSQLEAFLLPRIEAAERGELSTLTMPEILSKAHAQDVG
jgi:hypothetical protein